MPNATLRILLVEDSERRKQVLESWLPADVRFVWISDAGVAIGTLNKSTGRPYDGIMLDHDLTQRSVGLDGHRTNGLHVARIVAQRIDSDVPVFVHSANAGGASAIATVLRGAGFDVHQTAMPYLSPARFLDWVREVRRARAEADEDRVAE